MNQIECKASDGVSVLSGIEVTARGLAFLPIFHFEIGNLYSRESSTYATVSQCTSLDNYL